ncbi:Hint domain-containing protein [Mesobacterium pallidum]|uniref:Hint domain-containing protein n=1 Tax=Mesobacterium pallidum TaxID=2872037 RepID=UPI001EE39F49|nr:Hint domain-containing protein [Mesobacterium pallidum]
MVTYATRNWVNYDPDTGNLIGGPYGNNAGAYSIYDDGNDGIWTDGEEISLQGTTAIYEYQGTVEVNGTLYPLVLNTGETGTLLIMFDNYDDALWAVNNIPSVSGNGADFTACFGAGTQIATPDGQRAVETLAIGDPVLTVDGREIPVKWVGRQTVIPAFHLPSRLKPVLIKAGALGDGLPTVDLTLTADHALLIDGILVHAGALVNGTTIRERPWAETEVRFTVYHVETEAHDIILANGCPAETFIDNVGRRAFDNHAEYIALYGSEESIPELDLPRAMSQQQVPAALRAKLAARDAA